MTPPPPYLGEAAGNLDVQVSVIGYENLGETLHRNFRKIMPRFQKEYGQRFEPSITSVWQQASMRY